MTIDGVQGSGPLRPVQARRRTSAGGWIGPGQAGGTQDAPPVEVAASSGIGPMDGLLALQEVVGATEANRAAVDHGMTLLAGLGDLQRALLSGGDPGEALGGLEAELDALPAPGDDQRLRAVVADIRLRVQIELARRGQ